VPGFAVAPVEGGLGLDHVRGHPQRDLPVGRPVAAGEFRVAVLDGDVVAEEPRRLAAGVGDQGLVLAEFQAEGLPEERCQFGLDLLGFGLRPGESQDVIVGLCRGLDWCAPASLEALYLGCVIAARKRRIAPGGLGSDTWEDSDSQASWPTGLPGGSSAAVERTVSVTAPTGLVRGYFCSRPWAP
jgi:hypothetical protein